MKNLAPIPFPSEGIRFAARIPDQERQEFTFCFPANRRGFLKACIVQGNHGGASYIYRVPEGVETTNYHLSVWSWDRRFVSLHHYQGGWCQLHRAGYFSAYVPDGINHLKIDISVGMVWIEFSWKDDPL